MQEPWEIEYQKFQSAILRICEYIKDGNYSLPEINQLSTALMLAHKRVADVLLSPEEGTQNNHPVNFLNNVTNAYTDAYKLLILLRHSL